MATLVSVVDASASGTIESADELLATVPRPGRVGFAAWSYSPVALAVATDLAAVLSVGLLGTGLPDAGAPSTAGLAVLAAAWLTLLVAFGGYDLTPMASGSRWARAVLRAGVTLGLCFWMAPAVTDVHAPDRPLMLMTLALTAIGLAQRPCVLAWASRNHRAAGGTAVLVAGEADAVRRSVNELRRATARGWNVVSACVTAPVDDLDLDVPVTVGVDRVAEMVASTGAEVVLLIPCADLDPARLRRLAWQLEDGPARLCVATGLHDVTPCRTSVVSVGDLNLVLLRRRHQGSARLAKAVLERLGAVLLLLLLAPLMACVAIAVRRDSPGPAIFRQTRVGRHGREFTMYKFRTMTVGAQDTVLDLAERNESVGGLLFKIRRDPRITSIGAVLRRYSLDELPQLLNVARGEMALVGPRPALPGEVARYDIDPRRRLAVRPGLTGLWQVSGRSDLSWEDTVRLDLHYVDNWSLALDLRIIGRTLRAVVGHAGAY